MRHAYMDDPAGGCRGGSSRRRGVEIRTCTGVAASGEGEREPRDEAGGREHEGDLAHHGGNERARGTDTPSGLPSRQLPFPQDDAWFASLKKTQGASVRLPACEQLLRVIKVALIDTDLGRPGH
jgi:hypothetical protein